MPKQDSIQKNLEMIKNKERGYTRIPNVLLEDSRISDNGLLVFNALVYHLNTENFKCYPSIKKIKAISRKSLTCISEGLKELEGAGYINKIPQYNNGQQTSNLYVFTDYSLNHMEFNQDKSSKNKVVNIDKNNRADLKKQRNREWISQNPSETSESLSRRKIGKISF